MSVSTASVLTVEDDPIIRADLRLVLEDAGFSVCPDARDGIEAVALARDLRPDLVLLDLGLPHLDGVEATRQILAERDVPIVALTGRSRRLAEQALEAGARSYVLKPFAPGELVDALVEALEDQGERGTHAAREESRRALATLLAVLGYPEEYAVELERRSFGNGKLWRISA